MINPMLSQLNPTKNPMFGNLQNIKQMMGIIKSSKNPAIMLQNMANTNPQLKQALNYVNENGGDAKQAFYSMAKQNGVDPNEILSMLK